MVEPAVGVEEEEDEEEEEVDEDEEEAETTAAAMAAAWVEKARLLLSSAICALIESRVVY